MSSRNPAVAQPVCVIGAGAAGLAALRVLTDAGIEAEAFEASGTVGGLWNDGYDALHLITAKDLCSFEGFPIPDEYALFPHRDEIVNYFNAFADHFGLRQLIHFDTAVIAVEPVGSAGIDGWNVTTSNGDTRRFGAVIVANGHLWDPVTPAFAKDFTGKQLHSHYYRNPADFEGDRVLVVGAGNSGCDIAVDAVQERLKTSIAIRKGQVFQPKTLNGRGRTQLPIKYLPPVLRERVIRASIRIAYGTAADYTGLPAPRTRNVDRNPGVVNTQVLHWIHHGRLTVVPGVTGFTGSSARFTDGTTHEFDTVVFATGYHTRLPFLDDSLLTWSGEAPTRHAEGTLFPGVANLYVIGLVGPQGAQWPVYERQARAIRRLMTLQSHVDRPIVDVVAEHEPAWTDVNMLRYVWDARVARFERILRRLERRILPAGERPDPKAPLRTTAAPSSTPPATTASIEQEVRS